jgi:hypothetical protein
VSNANRTTPDASAKLRERARDMVAGVWANNDREYEHLTAAREAQREASQAGRGVYPVPRQPLPATRQKKRGLEAYSDEDLEQIRDKIEDEQSRRFGLDDDVYVEDEPDAESGQLPIASIPEDAPAGSNPLVQQAWENRQQ